MRKRKSLRTPSSAQVLEDRALLAANLLDGVLTIDGTDESDIVKVQLVEPESEEVESPEDPGLGEEAPAADPVLVVRVNEETFEFAPEDVLSVVVNTGDGDDVIRMSKTLDIPAEVDAGTGNDRVRTGAGDDVVTLGDGDDRVSTGDGNDNVDAGDGDDRVGGGRGADTLIGGLGSDRLRGGRGADLIEGGDGDDSVRGDADDDTLLGGGGNDRLSAGSGSNNLDGGVGNDTLFGNTNNDQLEGGDGENEIIDQVEIIGRAVDSVFANFDSNGNDLLDTEDGFLATMLVGRLAEDFDADQDGSISRDELTTAANDRMGKFIQRLENQDGQRGSRFGKGRARFGRSRR